MLDVYFVPMIEAWTKIPEPREGVPDVFVGAQATSPENSVNSFFVGVGGVVKMARQAGLFVARGPYGELEFDRGLPIVLALGKIAEAVSKSPQPVTENLHQLGQKATYLLQVLEQDRSQDIGYLPRESSLFVSSSGEAHYCCADY